MAGKTVGEIMSTSVVALHEEDNLIEAAKDIDTHNLRHLPVVDNGKLVGLVSQRDLLAASVSSVDPNANVALSRGARLSETTFIADVMTKDVITVRESASVHDAAVALQDGKFGCLPVTKEDGTLIGIVTAQDLLRHLAEITS